MMHLNGTAPDPRSEYPIPMSCNLHIVGERCSSVWLIDGDFCPVCEADKAKALAEEAAIEKARIEKEAENLAAKEVITPKKDDSELTVPSVEASNDQEPTKGMLLYSMNTTQG